MHYTILTENIALSNHNEPTWIQALPLGDYEHPVYGKINVTPDKVKAMATGVNSKVRETDLDIDYDHKLHDSKAAGWVKEADARPDGLYIKVAWTEPAHKALKNGEYKYFSPEFVDQWTHPKTKEKHDDVLLGGALTNRPFLKDIAPINLNDLEIEEESMDKLREALIKKFKLSDDATDEQVLAKIDDPAPVVKIESAAFEDGKIVVKTDDDKTHEFEADIPNAGSQDADSELVKLSESNPAIKKMLEDQEALRTKVRFGEVNDLVSGLNTDKKVLAPAASKKLTEVLVKTDEKTGNEVAEVVRTLLNDGIVPVNQKFVNDDDDKNEDSEKSAAMKFNEAVEKVANDEKLPYRQAMNKVMKDEPELYKAVTKEAS